MASVVRIGALQCLVGAMVSPFSRSMGDMVVAGDLVGFATSFVSRVTFQGFQDKVVVLCIALAHQ
jgi:hypothetical protein